MEVLVRETLTWEKINITNQKAFSRIVLDNGIQVTVDNVIAVKGKLNTSKYGYCSQCYKMMTEKQFEKHKHVLIDINKCLNCSYHTIVNQKASNTKDGIAVKGMLHCSHYNNQMTITKSKECPRYQCNNAKFVKEDNCFPTIRIPQKALTIKAFQNERWFIDYIGSNHIIYRNLRRNIEAKIDKHGYFIYFRYKGSNCVYVPDKCGEALVNQSGRIITQSDVIMREIRRLYT